MDHLKNILSGAASLLSSLAPRPYPPNGGFAQDRQELRSDWKRVGDGLRDSLKSEAKARKHDKPANPR